MQCLSLTAHKFYRSRECLLCAQLLPFHGQRAIPETRRSNKRVSKQMCYRHVPAMGWRGNGRPAATPVGARLSIATFPLTTTVRIPVASKNGLA